MTSNKQIIPPGTATQTYIEFDINENPHNTYITISFSGLRIADYLTFFDLFPSGDAAVIPWRSTLENLTPEGAYSLDAATGALGSEGRVELYGKNLHQVQVRVDRTGTAASPLTIWYNGIEWGL